LFEQLDQVLQEKQCKMSKSRLIVLWALIALFCVAGRVQAGTILQFGQANPNDVVTATLSGGVTSLSTAGNVDGSGVSVPVLITNFLGTPVVAIPAFETFIGVHSVGVDTLAGGQVIQSFVGTVMFSSLPGGLGADFLTATFVSPTLPGVVSGTQGGTQAQLSATGPPQLLILKSDFELAGFANPTSMTLGFSNVSPGLEDSTGSIRAFTGQNAGTFAASIVPEPSSMGMGAIALIAVSLMARYRRRKLAA
jgi:hypothetical protein